MEVVYSDSRENHHEFQDTIFRLRDENAERISTALTVSDAPSR